MSSSLVGSRFNSILNNDKIAFLCPSIPQTLEAAVVGVPHEKWQEVPKACIRLKEGAEVTGEEIQDFCRQRIARYKVPKEIEFEELPKTATGKIQKHKLRSRSR